MSAAEGGGGGALTSANRSRLLGNGKFQVEGVKVNVGLEFYVFSRLLFILFIYF